MTAYDLVVIGAGPGGYVAAIRAAQLGLSTAIVEREAVGGVCLNWGCIPSKALIRNAEVLSLVKSAGEYGVAVSGVEADYAAGVERSRGVVERLTRGVQGLLRKAKVEVVMGDATLDGPNAVVVGERRLEAKNVIVATGASPRALPGFEIDGERVVTYQEAIVQTDVPAQICIVGAGPIGVEFAYVYAAYGAKVTVVEAEATVLPGEDAEVTRFLRRYLERQGIEFLTSTKSSSVRPTEDGATVTMETSEGERDMRFDRVLVAVGVKPNTEGLGLESAGAQLERGFVKVDERLRANGAGLYAIGDVTGIKPLAHVAQAQGVYVAELIAGEEPFPLDYQGMPSAVYCNPQVASFGLTEQAAAEQGIEVKVGRFPLGANGKALALNEAEGFAKVVVDAHTGEILGAHLLGGEVTELLGELSLARIMEGTSMEVGAVVNAHPTISEAVKEAALAAEGKAVHI
ncbi:MAG: dihydrolipoyl dehydrogenase [Dehalococcoidia bacterium]|nr:dihydrolipoyl dehydrogenase [Dehalococcoidia bacterium]